MWPGTMNWLLMASLQLANISLASPSQPKVVVAQFRCVPTLVNAASIPSHTAHGIRDIALLDKDLHKLEWEVWVPVRLVKGDTDQWRCDWWSFLEQVHKQLVHS